ncbi:MAG: chorismate mutase [Candidatus Bathyarchaeota archaeon]
MVEELAKLRKIIDDIDCKLAKLLIERLKVVSMVAEVKRRHGLNVYDAKRVEEVLANVKKIAENENFNPKIVEEIYRFIVDYCIRLEEKLLGLNVNA